MKRNTLKAYGSVIAMTAIQTFATGRVFAAGEFTGGNDLTPSSADVANPTVTSASGLKSTLGGIGNDVLSIITLLVTIIAVLYLIYSGYMYVTSAGDPEKAKKARAGIINSIIGIIIIVSAWAIIRFAVNAGGGIGGSISTN